MIALTHAFGLSREPFAQDIPVEQLYQLPVPSTIHQQLTLLWSVRAQALVWAEVQALVQARTLALAQV